MRFQVKGEREKKWNYIYSECVIIFYSKFVQKHVSCLILLSFFYGDTISCDWRLHHIMPFVLRSVHILWHKNSLAHIHALPLIFQTNIIWFEETFIRCNLLLFSICYVFGDFLFSYSAFPMRLVVYFIFVHISVHLIFCDEATTANSPPINVKYSDSSQKNSIFWGNNPYNIVIVTCVESLRSHL